MRKNAFVLINFQKTLQSSFLFQFSIDFLHEIQNTIALKSVSQTVEYGDCFPFDVFISKIKLNAYSIEGNLYSV